MNGLIATVSVVVIVVLFVFVREIVIKGQVKKKNINLHRILKFIGLAS